MIAAVSLLVAAGVVAVLAAGLASGFDAIGVVILAAIVALGLVAVGVARRFRAGLTTPRTCPECAGLVSPNAPYCKHCGVALHAEIDPRAP